MSSYKSLIIQTLGRKGEERLCLVEEKRDYRYWLFLITKCLSKANKKLKEAVD